MAFMRRLCRRVLRELKRSDPHGEGGQMWECIRARLRHNSHQQQQQQQTTTTATKYGSNLLQSQSGRSGKEKENGGPGGRGGGAKNHTSDKNSANRTYTHTSKTTRSVSPHPHCEIETSLILAHGGLEIKSDERLLEAYLLYIESSRRHRELLCKYQGKGERSIEESARIVGLSTKPPPPAMKQPIK